jgi:protein O-mannosyl-transferase
MSAPNNSPGRLRANQSAVALVLILLMTCAAYWPALSGGFLWDDDAHVPKLELQSTEGLHRIWFEFRTTPQYYPLLYTSFWVQHRLWGDNPTGYHIVNLLLHLGVVLSSYVLLRKLNVPGALLAAAIFAIHPVNVESVAWISEQKNTLSFLLCLGALIAYLNFDSKREWFPYALSFALFLCSLLSKTVTATLPAVILVLFWWKRGTLSWRRDVLPLIPFFALGIGFGLLSAYAEHQWTGANGESYDLSWLQRGLLAGRVICFYVGKLVWPVHLVFSYPRWTIDPSNWAHWIYPAAVVLLFLGLWAIRQRSRAPLAAFLLYAGTLFPALGFLNVFPFVYSYVADHFQYQPSLSLISLGAAGITSAFDKARQQRAIRQRSR